MKKDIDEQYKKIESRFIAWAEKQDHIRAAFVLGSRARSHFPADEWSDLDIAVYSDQPDSLISKTDWLKEIGSPVLSFIEPAAVGDSMERRVLFDGGLDVDFAVSPVNLLHEGLSGLLTPELSFLYADILRRGIRVLVDKDGLLKGLPGLLSKMEKQTQKPIVPKEDEFFNLVYDFWYHILWTAKKLKRGEIWIAGGCLDSYLKRKCLLTMMEWHARLKNRAETWFRGRFLEKWAEPRILSGLHGAFAHYDREDIKRALFCTVELFRLLSRETAEMLNLNYPSPADKSVTEMINGLLK
jgi:aminoglycoside 6-adenylyltransferase